MNHKFKHIVKKAKTMSLSSKEKEQIRSTLLQYVESHQLNSESGNFVMTKKVAYYRWIYENLNNRQLMIPVAFSLLIILTGGISFASNSSLPGGVLYPIKILGEKIDSALTLDPKDKVEILTLNATNRLVEAEKLYINGRFDTNAETRLVKSFENHSEVANESIMALQKDDKESATTANRKFISELDRHQKILKTLSSLNSGISNNKLSDEIDITIKKLNLSSKSDENNDKADSQKTNEKDWSRSTNVSSSVNQGSINGNSK